MIQPIYEKETVLYGNNGKYKLLKKEGNIVTYEFTPWDEKKSQRIESRNLSCLSDLLGVRILWAVYEDI